MHHVSAAYRESKATTALALACGIFLCAFSGQSMAVSLTLVSDQNTLFAASGTDDLGAMDNAITSGLNPVPSLNAIENRQGTGIYQIPGTQVINSNPSSYYVGLSGYYQTTFELPTGFTHAQLELQVVGDDQGNAFLNRNSLGGTFYWNSAGAFGYSTNDPSNFHAGTNFLTFDVSNSGGGPTGLSYLALVTYDVAANVPEPATQALLLAGLAATGLAWRRQPRR